MTLEQLTDEQLLNELRRRKALDRGRGRPKQPSPCPKCGVECAGFRDAREHCRKKRSAK